MKSMEANHITSYQQNADYHIWIGSQYISFCFCVLHKFITLSFSLFFEMFYFALQSSRVPNHAKYNSSFTLTTLDQLPRSMKNSTLSFVIVGFLIWSISETLEKTFGTIVYALRNNYYHYWRWTCSTKRFFLQLSFSLYFVPCAFGCCF